MIILKALAFAACVTLGMFAKHAEVQCTSPRVELTLTSSTTTTTLGGGPDAELAR